jgi:hypothetical protein
MGSGAVIYVPGFIKIGSGVQKLIWRIHRHTHTEQRDLISLLYFFKIRKVGYKSNLPACQYWKMKGIPLLNGNIDREIIRVLKQMLQQQIIVM